MLSAAGSRSLAGVEVSLAVYDAVKTRAQVECLGRALVAIGARAIANAKANKV
jgi:hypothetical protein